MSVSKNCLLDGGYTCGLLFHQQRYLPNNNSDLYLNFSSSWIILIIQLMHIWMWNHIKSSHKLLLVQIKPKIDWDYLCSTYLTLLIGLHIKLKLALFINLICFIIQCVMVTMTCNMRKIAKNSSHNCSPFVIND
jgi:hypothetical protein